MWYSSTVSSEKLLTLSACVFYAYASFTLSWYQKENVFILSTLFCPKLNFIFSSLGWFSSLHCLKNIISWCAVIITFFLIISLNLLVLNLLHVERLDAYKLIITIQVLYNALFLPDKIWHVFKDRSLLFPHNLTSKHNVMITLCDCFCTYSVAALLLAVEVTPQIKIAWS